MGNKRIEVRDFLVSRRGKITPDQAGLQYYGTNRRVTGLRREEVAMLAGLSIDHYTRLEKGNITGVSETVLHAVADALQLDEAERAYLFDLSRAANASARAPRRARAQHVRSTVQHIIDAMTTSPAFVRNNRLDILATNPLGRALYAPVLGSSVMVADQRPNLARFQFLDPHADDFLPEGELLRNICVDLLRTEAGRDPYDKALTNLVGELSTRSADFRTRWAAQNVRLHRAGVKKFHHPVVGDLDLDFEAMELSAHGGLVLTAYTAEPGSHAADALNLLASWAATQNDTGTEPVSPSMVRPQQSTRRQFPDRRSLGSSDAATPHHDL
jgi:transcriptional regulator with XRE-family HTH domain